MDRALRDIDCMEHIVRHCRNVRSDRMALNDSLADFLANETYQRSCVLPLAQIGEVSTRVYETFKESHPEILWQEIRRLRNFLIHEYERVNLKEVWGTMTVNVPELQAACERILEEADGV